MDPDYLLSLPPRITRQSYGSRDTILYALGVGAGQSGDPSELAFVYEEGLKALPTMAAVLAYPGFWQKEPQYGIDWRRVLHGGQSLRIHAPIPAAGEVRSMMAIESIVDKGPGRGAILTTVRQLVDERDGALLATVRQVSMLRGDGGRGGSGPAASAPHPIPARPPDRTAILQTRPEQALLYRLSGDFNPLHADPAVAKHAGLKRPVLHGLCSYGFAARALIGMLCAHDPARPQRLDCRFTAPAYPGDGLVLDVWEEGSGCAAFRCTGARNAVVLDNGFMEFGA